MNKFCALFIVLLASLCLVQAQAGSPLTKSVKINLSGGLPDCTQCGQPGQYACSNGIGKWNDGKFSFTDPLNATEASKYYLANINANVYGNFGCDQTAGGYTDMKVFVAGTLLQITRTQNDGYYCACGRCNSLSFTGNYIAGYPNYKMGYENSLDLFTLKNYACVSYISITLTYYPRPNQNTLYTTYNDFKTTQPNGCAYCGNYDQYTCSNQDPNLWANNSSLSIRVMDPLPYNSILYMLNVTAYGVFGCASSSSSSFTISTYLQDILINSNSVYSNPNACVGSSVACGSPVLFKAKNGFPAGWPKYKYADTNIVRFDLSYASYVSCVSRFDFIYLYYTKGSNKLNTMTVSSRN